MSRPPRLLQGIIAHACVLCLALLVFGAASPAPALAQSPDLCTALPPGGIEVTPAELHEPWDAYSCSAVYRPPNTEPKVRILATLNWVAQGWLDAVGPVVCAEESIEGFQCTPSGVGEAGIEAADVQYHDWSSTSRRGNYQWMVMASYVEGNQTILAQARDINRQIDVAVQALPATSPSDAQPPPNPPPGRFGVGHGCSYNEPGISDGQVVCAATYTNEPPGAVIAYKWTLDGKEQTETGSTFSRKDEQLAAGEHTIVVVAVDTRTNATSESSSFQFTKAGEPAATEAPEFAVKLKFCHYEGTYDRVSCSAEVVNPPDGADIVYEWLFDGKRQGESGSGLTVQLAQPVKFGRHPVQVRAVDRNSGKKTGVAQTFVEVGTAPPQGLDALIELVTNAGISQLLPGKSADVNLKSKGDRAEVKARCEKLAYETLLFVMLYDDELNFTAIATGIPGTQVVLSSLALKCGEMLDKASWADWPVGPQQAVVGAAVSKVAAAPLPNGPLRTPFAAESDLPAQFRVEMLRGPIRIEVANEKTFLSVETAETVVTSQGKATYGVGFDPKSGKTVVRAYQGTVKVKPWAVETPFDLTSGQQVEVTDSGAGAVAPISNASAGTPTEPIRSGNPSPVSNSAPVALPGGLPVWLGGAACLVLVVVLAGVIGLIVFTSKRRRVPMPPPPGSVQGYPSRATLARLVVVQGSAGFPWLDLPPTGIIIGRNQDCGLVLGDTLASRYHARIDCAQGRWTITDMNSSNGTFVNGARVMAQMLSPGDQIQIGSTVLRFEQ